MNVITNLIVATVLQFTNQQGTLLFENECDWATNAYVLEVCTGSIITAMCETFPLITDAEESVALVTNVSTNVTSAIVGWNAGPCPDSMSGCLVLHGSPVYDTPPTERTETTTVTEIKTLRFRWDGEACEVKREREISRRVRVWWKKDEWVEVLP